MESKLIEWEIRVIMKMKLNLNQIWFVLNLLKSVLFHIQFIISHAVQNEIDESMLKAKILVKFTGTVLRQTHRSLSFALTYMTIQPNNIVFSPSKC